MCICQIDPPDLIPLLTPAKKHVRNPDLIPTYPRRNQRINAILS